jgi:hypothetical protein
MSKISNVIARTVLLWAYVGIGPMIGAGPLDRPPVRRTRMDAPDAVPQQDRACDAAASPGVVAESRSYRPHASGTKPLHS